MAWLLTLIVFHLPYSSLWKFPLTIKKHCGSRSIKPFEDIHQSLRAIFLYSAIIIITWLSVVVTPLLPVFKGLRTQRVENSQSDWATEPNMASVPPTPITKSASSRYFLLTRRKRVLSDATQDSNEISAIKQGKEKTMFKKSVLQRVHLAISYSGRSHDIEQVPQP